MQRRRFLQAAGSAGTLKRDMPVECVTGNPAERRRYALLARRGRRLSPRFERQSFSCL